MKLIKALSLEEYFKFKLDHLFNKTLDEETKFYLVSLLSRFGKSDNFFDMNNGKNDDESTVELFLEAEDEKNIILKKLLFQRIGDICLYSVGILSRDSSYYGFIGKSAYSSAVKLSTKEKPIFRNLCSEFDFITEKIRTIKF